MYPFPALVAVDNPKHFYLFCSNHCRDSANVPTDTHWEKCQKKAHPDFPTCWQCGKQLKTTSVEVKFMHRSREITAYVVNPGDWYGRGYLVWVEDCFDPPIFFVEADSEQDAIEEFVSNDATKHMCAIEFKDYGDYGHSVSDGDIIGGVTYHSNCWLDLNGQTHLVDPGLKEPEFGPGGELYDGENLHIEKVENIRYFGVYEDIPLPGKGVRSTNFDKWREYVETK